jgi:hypothetical protein
LVLAPVAAASVLPAWRRSPSLLLDLVDRMERGYLVGLALLPSGAGLESSDEYAPFSSRA